MTISDTEETICLPLKIGHFFSSIICFDATSVQLFASLVGDLNPLHHDMKVAESRFGGLIASGIHTSSILAGMVASKLCSLQPSLGLEMSFCFKRPVYVGEKMIAKWVLTAIEPKNSLKGDIVTFKGELLTFSGTLLVSGTVVSLVN